MKITINEKKQNTEIKYPCLMQSLSSPDLVVFMLRSGHGLVVRHSGDRYRDLEMEDSWIMPNFKPFQGSITLSNEE